MMRLPKVDLTVVAIPGFIGAMVAEHLWLRAHPAAPGTTRAGDYELKDTIASLTHTPTSPGARGQPGRDAGPARPFHGCRRGEEGQRGGADGFGGDFHVAMLGAARRLPGGTDAPGPVGLDPGRRAGSHRALAKKPPLRAPEGRAAGPHRRPAAAPRGCLG